MLIKHFPFRGDARLLKGKAGPPRNARGRLFSGRGQRSGQARRPLGGRKQPPASGLAPAPTWALLVCSSGLGPCVIQEEGADTSPQG